MVCYNAVSPTICRAIETVRSTLLDTCRNMGLAPIEASTGFRMLGFDIAPELEVDLHRYNNTHE